jgi:septum formation protein
MACGPLPLVLASASPQRRAILEQLGVAFTATPADVEEYTAGEPASVAELNALRKAKAVARAGQITLGVDTVVALDDRIFGKPRDAPQARATLRRLGGRTHDVVSGMAVIEGEGPPRTATAVTKVTFRPLDDAWLTWYVGTEEWRGRAGGYAVQGAGQALVTRIDGEHSNVVGLPVGLLLALLPGVLPVHRGDGGDP